jgi:hypothetical protein
LADNSRYQPYSKETAICVDLALDSVEADIRHELTTAVGIEADALRRVLKKMQERRKILEQFMQVA